MITIQEEGAEMCVGTLTGLFKEHGDSVIGPAFNLNLIAFARCVTAGLMRFFVIRDNGEAVGYCCFCVEYDLMVAHKKVADCAAIYVRPQYRGRPVIRMIKLAESAFKNDGIDIIRMHSPEVSSLYTKMGYTSLEHIYDKEL